MPYLIMSWLVEKLWWNRRGFRSFLALILFNIGIKPKAAFTCVLGGLELEMAGYFEIKEPKWMYFEVALPLPYKVAKAYYERVEGQVIY